MSLTLNENNHKIKLSYKRKIFYKLKRLLVSFNHIFKYIHPIVKDFKYSHHDASFFCIISDLMLLYLSMNFTKSILLPFGLLFNSDLTWLDGTILIVLLTYTLFSTFRLYTSNFQPTPYYDKTHDYISVLLVSLVITSLLHIVIFKSYTSYLLSTYIFFFVVSASLIALNHNLFKILLLVLNRNGAYTSSALILKTSRSLLNLEPSIFMNYGPVKVINTLNYNSANDLVNLSEDIMHFNIDTIFIQTPWDEIPKIYEDLKSIAHLSVKVLLFPDYSSFAIPINEIELEGNKITFSQLARPISGWAEWAKRKEDLLVALTALLLLSPLLFFIALAIKLDSKGPVLFLQQRVGFNGKNFLAYKFRTMYHNSADLDATIQTSKNDRRVTKIGKYLRKYSLDELPQLLNVLFGSMSVVGPRPHALKTSTQGMKLDEIVSTYAYRHRVKPGITGWAQVNGFRGELDTIYKLQQRVNYDLVYIERWNIFFDIKIILLTIPLLIFDKNAY